MNIKFLLAVGLTLSTTGFSLPALAGERSPAVLSPIAGDPFPGRCTSIEHLSPRNYYPYGDNLPRGFYIYVGAGGDYFDRNGNYHKALQYPQYYNAKYDYAQLGNYYDCSGRYHEAIHLIQNR
jgi:hypothetical protein